MPSKLGNTTFYTVREVADCLGKSYNTIASRIKGGEIPSSEFGGVKGVSHDDLVNVLNEVNLPESIIEYRLGFRSPKTDKPIKQGA